MSKKPLPTKPMESEDFEEAYNAHSERIFGFMFWRTRDSKLSEDLTSSVFEKAWRARSQFHGGSARAWLFAIARNVLTDHWRSKKTVPLDEPELLPDESEDIGEKLDTAVRVAELRSALGKLSPEARAVVELRFIEGLSARQVASRLGTSEGNVRIMQYRALRRMREFIHE